jgi:translation initiation factor 3 subunit F
VIGTLLGINFDGLIEIRSCFPVPHTEKENVRIPQPLIPATPISLAYQVAVDTEFHKTMLDLHQKAHPKEVIIGWYLFPGLFRMQSDTNS